MGDRRMRRTWIWALVLVATEVATSGVSFADGSGARSAAAQSLFDDAVALATKGDFAAAVEKFKASQQLDPSRGTLLGLAMAEERADMLASAMGHYQQLLHEASKAHDDARAQQARQGIERIEPIVPHLTLELPSPMPKGASIVPDDADLPVGVAGSPLPVDPGAHRIEVRADGYQPFMKTVQASRGQRLRVGIELLPIETLAAEQDSTMAVGDERAGRPESHGTDGVRLLGYAAAGVGALSLATGAVLLIKSDNLYAETQDACANNMCPEDKRGDIDDGRAMQNWGNGLVIVGSALAVTGVTLLLWPSQDTHEGNAGRHGVELAVSPAGATMLGRF